MRKGGARPGVLRCLGILSRWEENRSWGAAGAARSHGAAVSNWTARVCGKARQPPASPLPTASIWHKQPPARGAKPVWLPRHPVRGGERS